MTEAPAASEVPEAGDAVIQDADAAAVHATAAEARFLTVIVAAVVVPSAHDSLSAAGDACSGGETVNTSGNSSSSTWGLAHNARHVIQGILNPCFLS